MIIAQVTGSVVSTQKLSAMTGRKLLVVEPLRLDETSRSQLRPLDGHWSRWTSLGAGPGEVVLLCQGSSARLTPETSELPVDTVVIGIVDSVGIEERTVFQSGTEIER